MRRKTFIPLLFALALVAGPVLAGEVVYFTNGTSLPIESYSIEEGTISVLLGGESYFAFPLNQVDRIESAGAEIDLSAERASNRMVPSPKGTAQTGITPARYRRGQWETDIPDGRGQKKESVETDKNGLAVYRPYGSNAPPNKRQFGVHGRRELMSSQPRASSAGGHAGASSRVGARYVLPPEMSGGVKRRQPVGMTTSTNTGTGNGGKDGGESSEEQ